MGNLDATRTVPVVVLLGVFDYRNIPLQRHSPSLIFTVPNHLFLKIYEEKWQFSYPNQTSDTPGSLDVETGMTDFETGRHCPIAPPSAPPTLPGVARDNGIIDLARLCRRTREGSSTVAESGKKSISAPSRPTSGGRRRSTRQAAKMDNAATSHGKP